MARIVETGGSGVSPTIEKLTSAPPAMFVPRTVKQLKTKSVIENRNEVYCAVRSRWTDVIQHGINDTKMEYSNLSYQQEKLEEDPQTSQLTDTYSRYQEVKIDKLKMWDKIMRTHKRREGVQ